MGFSNACPPVGRSKKVIIILVALAILILGGVGGYLFVSLRNKNLQPKNSGNTSLIKEVISGNASYEDESGFSFSYPKAIKISDVTPDDEIFYSKLNLTKGNDKLVISVYDAKSLPDYSQAKLVGATTLGGLSAKQYSLDQKLITVAPDSGIIYLIEGLKDDDYWEEVQNVVVSSFTFGKKETSKTTTSDDSNAIYEEEEIVE